MRIRAVFGQGCRSTRIALDLSQQQLADAIGIHRGHLANIEAGRANISVDLMDRIADVVGLRLQLMVDPPAFFGTRRAHDTVHAWCSGYISRRLGMAGWLVAREVDVSSAGVRGWIDLLAFHPAARILAIVEIKTRLEDLGGLERQVGWYERHAFAAAARQGWRPRRIVVWMLGLASAEVDDAVLSHRDVVGNGFPGRAGAMLETIAGGEPTARRSIALVDPASRRANWLIPTRLEGRRRLLPYRDYGDAVRRIPQRRR